MTFDNLLESLRASSNLALPPGIGDSISLEEKLRIGAHETAMRALEVAEVQFCSSVETKGDANGRLFGEAVVRLLKNLLEARASQVDVWEDGVTRVLDVLRRGETFPGPCPWIHC